MALSEYADWWDQQHRETDKILEEWVQDNPQWWAIGLATATATAADLGAGMVDALRFGEGAAEGGVKGYGTDALRLLVIAGPLARAGGMLSRLGQMSRLRVAVRVRGVTHPCTFQAVNNAMSIVGGKGRSLFVTIRDMAQALGRPLSSIGRSGGRYRVGAWIDDLIPFLQRQGVKIRNLGQPNTLDDVVNAAQSNDGVIVFAIRWVDRSGVTRKHSMIAMRDALGRVRFADYGGKFLRSLDDLALRGQQWAATSGYSVYTKGAKGTAVLFDGSKLTGLMEHAQVVMNGAMLLIWGIEAVETPDTGVELAIPVETVAAIDPKVEDAEVVKTSFEAYRARRRQQPLKRLPRRPRTGNGVPRAEYLTGVQYRLNAAGFGAGPVDGINGPRTKRAVREFQRAYGLRVDAIPGPRTQARLVEVCGY